MIDANLFEQQNPLHSVCANKAANGLWLRYYWYAGKHQSQKEWDDMLERLRVNQIKYAYFHVLTTKSDGSLKMRRQAGAIKITNAVHERVPGTKAIAWVYVGAAPQRDGLDLSKPDVRKKLIQEALWLVNDCGFDGIQWDYEFCSNGDRGLLALLDETRAVLKPTQLLGVDTPMWYPNTLWGWNDQYFREVAARCDQLCVMCYDSYLYLPRAYAWLMSQQVVHVSQAVAAANKSGMAHCEAIFGLPTYEDATLAHRARCESLANSLRGLNQGLSSAETVGDVIGGVALFADYTTDDVEWDTYRKYWLHCERPGD
ncbi:MAG: hypothetical protein EKK48_01565 [Candidatus Melainabacteria bacterium]|nr:MAG: hypothetical protein EKK48_01565 [Candidatus Melainabacteria bacterium]